VTQAATKERYQPPKLLDYFLAADLSFATESRPSRRAGKAAVAPPAKHDSGPDAKKEIVGPDGGPSGTESMPAAAAGSGRPCPEDGWTTVRRVDVNERTLRSVKQNLDLKRDTQPDIFQVKAAVPALFIGMEAGGRRRPVLTDKNPHVEVGLKQNLCLVFYHEIVKQISEPPSNGVI
jgi:hypothetical protein